MELAGDASGSAAIAAGIPGVENAAADGMILRFDILGEARQIVPEVVSRVAGGGGRILSLARDARDLRSLYHLSVEGDGAAASSGGRHV